MRKFVCNDCGGVSYSSAALENQKHPDSSSTISEDTALAAAWLLMLYCHQKGTLYQNTACEGCSLQHVIGCSPEGKLDQPWNWDVPNSIEVGIEPLAAEQSSDGVLKSQQVLYQCDPERNSSCAATRCYLNGGPCRHTTDPAFAMKSNFDPGAKGVPAKELLAVQFEEVFDDEA